MYYRDRAMDSIFKHSPREGRIKVLQKIKFLSTNIRNYRTETRYDSIKLAYPVPMLKNFSPLCLLTIIIHFKACYNCPHNISNCYLPHCVPGDGVERGIVTVNRYNNRNLVMSFLSPPL